MIEMFKGPLGSHRNYIIHIALANQRDYRRMRKKHEEEGRTATPDKYREFRLFLNAVESFNNVLDYMYFEYEGRIRHRTLETFRSAVHKKYPQLGELSELANAYKHCVRRNNDQLRARDVQAPRLNIRVKLGEACPSVTAEYEFPWPVEKHESKLYKVFDFWLEYDRNPNTDELINA